MSVRNELAEAIAEVLAATEDGHLPTATSIADAIMVRTHSMTIENQATLIGGSRSQKKFTNPDGTVARVIWVTR